MKKHNYQFLLHEKLHSGFTILESLFCKRVIFKDPSCVYKYTNNELTLKDLSRRIEIGKMLIQNGTQLHQDGKLGDNCILLTIVRQEHFLCTNKIYLIGKLVVGSKYENDNTVHHIYNIINDIFSDINVCTCKDTTYELFPELEDNVNNYYNLGENDPYYDHDYLSISN